MQLKDNTIEALAERANDAVEVVLPNKKPVLASIIGPIRTWWGRMDSDEYKAYSQWRSAVQVALIDAGHLVYSPHQAWQGAWHEHAQYVNDVAIIKSDVIIILTPPDVEAVGTAAEIAVAEAHQKLVIKAPPAGIEDLVSLLDQIEIAFKA